MMQVGQWYTISIPVQEWFYTSDHARGDSLRAHPFLNDVPVKFLGMDETFTTGESCIFQIERNLYDMLNHEIDRDALQYLTCVCVSRLEAGIWTMHIVRDKFVIHV
jgi:hypothetical protein